MRKLAAHIILIGLSLGSPARASGLAEDEGVQSRLELLDRWIVSQMEYSGLPGLVIGIVHDQDVVWLKAFGHADVERGVSMRTDSIFRIASHSKLFTSIAVMQLRDQGELSLSDPIVKHLPWFDIHDRHAESPEITVWHLLTHSSGIPRESDHPYWTEFDFPTVEEVKVSVTRQETTYPRETKYKYSNLALTLAGMIVEEVSGRSFEEYVETEIMAPLGMASSSVGVPSDDHRKRLATGYGRPMPDGAREAFPFIDARAFDPATGLSSTVEDMLRFLSWQMRVRARKADDVLRTNTLLEMQRVHWLNADWESGRGIGFGVYHTEERDLVGHGGSYPGYRTNTMLSPEENIGVVVFTNGGDGNPNRYVRKAFEWVAPAIVEAVEGEPEPKVADPAWSLYVGTYRSRGSDRSVLILDGELVVISPMSEEPTESMGVLVPVGEHTFRLEAETMGPHGELVRFELDDEGNVTKMYMGSNYSERIGGQALIIR